MNYWMSLFCQYATFSLLLSFFNWALRCYTYYFKVKFFTFTSSYSSILFFSSYSIRLSLWILYSNSIFAYNIFFQCNLAYYFNLFPLRKAYFISFNFIANYYCLFFSFSFCCYNVKACFFSSSFFSNTDPNTFYFYDYSSFYFYFCSFAEMFYRLADTFTLFSIILTPSGGRLPSSCFLSLSIYY